MSVNIEIRPNDFNPKQLTIPQIASLMNLSYGVSNNHYCLDRGKIGTYTILYDEKKIGRGFEVWHEENSICMRLPLPTTSHDIDTFYKLTEKICKELDVYFYNCEGETVTINDVYANVENDKNGSMDAIHHIAHSTADGDNKYLILFGAVNPVFIGVNECREIGDSLEGFDRFMHHLQSLDAFYATPRFYQRQDGSVFGMYFVGEDIVTTVPLEPKSPFHKIDNMDGYYVRLPDGNDVPYNDFISNIRMADYYDAGHITLKLTEADVQMLVDNYTVDTSTKRRKKGIYWGKILDNGNWHGKKVANMSLNTEEINGYNHLAVFLRWAKEHGYLSLDLMAACPQLLLDAPDYRSIIKDHYVFGRCLRINHFCEEIQDFIRKFYVFGGNGFPVCVDRYAEKVLGNEKYNCEEYKDEAYLFVPYDEEYYEGLSEYIENEWNKYNR